MKYDPSKYTPTVKKWTAKEFHHTFSATELYWKRPYLIRGIVWEHGPECPPHAAVRGGACEILRPCCGDARHVRQRCPLVLTDDTDLMPDVAVVTGHIRTYMHAHPRTAELVMEISDNSLHEDLHQKAELNAEYGIPDYWVLDVLGRRLFVFRGPRRGMCQKFEYGEITIHEPGMVVSPLFAPDAVIPVADLLP